MRSISLILIVSALLLACKTNSSSEHSQIKHIKEEIKPKSTDKLELANFQLDIPGGWKQEQPTGSMRVAQLYIEEDPTYKITVFTFGEQDMIEENIARWRKQFTVEDNYSELNLENQNLKAIRIVGTYMKKKFPMAKEFTETPEYGTLAAILPSNEGPYYFKLSAPKEVINKQEKNFIDLLNSCKTKS